MTASSFDVVVVGAGVVGLTVARELLHRKPTLRIAIVEKEAMPGLHASGRNSGVMHSGIYYGAETLKAKVCAAGAQRMIEFAAREGIAHRICGKIILATSEEQLPTLERLLDNARRNRIPAERLDSRQVLEIEPHAAPEAWGIYCPTTAVIDSKAVLSRLQQRLIARGVEFLFDCAVLQPAEESLLTTRGRIHYGYLYNCAGAHADRLAKAFGLAQDYELVPFKGIYWKLSEKANSLVRANIYPVPDISLPFLGVHLTRVIGGEVYIGPTAIPALGRENYGVLAGARASEAAAIGLRLAAMYWRNEYNFRRLAHNEIGKYRKKNFLAAARKLLPALNESDMVPTTKAGIRPQLVNLRTRRLEMDYLLSKTDRSLHVLNAISPAFTSAFAFAETIVDESGYV